MPRPTQEDYESFYSYMKAKYGEKVHSSINILRRNYVTIDSDIFNFYNNAHHLKNLPGRIERISAQTLVEETKKSGLYNVLEVRKSFNNECTEKWFISKKIYSEK